MDRRDFLKSAAVSVAAVGIGQSVFAEDRSYPTKVDAKLFEAINRVKDPANKSPLEKSHAPMVTAILQAETYLPGL